MNWLNTDRARTHSDALEAIEARVDFNLADQKGRAIGARLTVVSRPDRAAQPKLGYPAEAAHVEANCFATRDGAVFGAYHRPRVCATMEEGKAIAEQMAEACRKRYAKKFESKED